MAVATETIVEALKYLLELEEFSVENLAEVERYNFRFLPRPDVRKIHTLLAQLREDTGEHKKIIQDLIVRMEQEVIKKCS